MYTKRTSNLPLICLICGDVARGINFDVMSCMSCKIFFRRHALKSETPIPCQRIGNCEITKLTRRSCSACRLKKCYQLGMNSQLIRRWSYHPLKTKDDVAMETANENSNTMPNPLPIGLLNHDRSLLSKDEWNLLSNIVHGYDEANTIPQIKSTLNEQASLPPKLRSKASNSLFILKIFISQLQPFMERSSYFKELSIDLRQLLLKNNTEIAGTMNTLFLIREIDALENAVFTSSCTAIYGYEIIKLSKSLTVRLETNGILVKAMILILGFSTNCSVTTFQNSRNMMTLSTALTVFNIQNMLTTMFWKYLNYQYGFLGAVRRFDRLIGLTLVMLKSANDMRNENHEKLINSLVLRETDSASTRDNSSAQHEIHY